MYSTSLYVQFPKENGTTHLYKERRNSITVFVGQPEMPWWVKLYEWNEETRMKWEEQSQISKTMGARKAICQNVGLIHFLTYVGGGGWNNKDDIRSPILVHLDLS
jgi:hypothetical protein